MMNDFNKFPNFRFWTQRVLPCVFDESLSYVEKINKLEQMINDLIDEYNKFGQQVTNEVNTFEAETNQKIQDFINQVTQIINDFKQQVTTEITRFEKQVTDSQNEYEKSMNALYAQFTQSINSTIEEFENRVTEQQNLFMTQVNNRINTMQAVVDDIPETVANTVNEVAIPWLNANVPAMVESSVANNVNKVFDVDTLIYVTHDESIEDLNNWTTTGLYYGTSLSILSNYPTNIESGDMYWCFVGHTDSDAVEITIQQTLYLNNGSCFTRSYENTNNAWNPWVRVSNTFRNIDSNSTVDFNTFFFTNNNYGLNDTWIGVYNSTKWSNVPSNLIDGDVVKVNIYYYFTSSNRVTVQVINKIYSTSNHFTSIGKTWSRKGVGSTFSSWNPTTLDYQYKEILANTQLNDLTETGIYTVSSESNVTIGGLPSTALQYGSFYIRVTANNIGYGVNEIIQEIINSGNGCSIYMRELTGSQWSNWKKIGAELVYSTNKTFTIGNSTPYWWDNIVTTLKYNFSDMPNYECQIDVWNSMLTGYLQIPLVVGCTMTNYAGTNAVNLTPTVYCPLADEIVSDQTFTMNIKVFKRY